MQILGPQEGQSPAALFASTRATDNNIRTRRYAHGGATSSSRGTDAGGSDKCRVGSRRSKACLDDGADIAGSRKGVSGVKNSYRTEYRPERAGIVGELVRAVLHHKASRARWATRRRRLCVFPPTGGTPPSSPRPLIMSYGSQYNISQRRKIIKSGAGRREEKRREEKDP